MKQKLKIQKGMPTNKYYIVYKISHLDFKNTTCMSPTTTRDRLRTITRKQRRTT